MNADIMQQSLQSLLVGGKPNSFRDWVTRYVQGDLDSRDPQVRIKTQMILMQTIFTRVFSRCLSVSALHGALKIYMHTSM